MERTKAQRLAGGMVVLSCFSLLSWLNGRYVGHGAGQVAAFTVIGILLACACLAGMAALALLSAPSLRASGGFAAACWTVSRAYLLALPFALLALLADLAFGWNAATAFMQAAIMTSGAAVGAELSRSTGPKIRHMVVCMGGAFLFSILWIAYSAIFASAAGPKAVG